MKRRMGGLLQSTVLNWVLNYNEILDREETNRVLVVTKTGLSQELQEGLVNL